MGRDLYLAAMSAWQRRIGTGHCAGSSGTGCGIMKVRDVIRVIERGGWRLVRTKGSHRQFKHDSKPGVVTIAGHRSKELHPETLRSIWKQAQLGEKP